MDRPSRLLLLGLVLATIGALVPGFHHVRVGATMESDAQGMGQVPSSFYEETFPSEVIPWAAGAGLVGGVLVLQTSAKFMGRGETVVAARGLAGLAAVLLLATTLPPLAGWASTGFDLTIQTPTGCQGGARAFDMPLWLQHPTCVSWLTLLTTPLLALAGLLALAWATGSPPRLLGAALATVGLAMGLFVVWLALGLAGPTVSWVAPAVAGALLGAAITFARPRRDPGATQTL